MQIKTKLITVCALFAVFPVVVNTLFLVSIALNETSNAIEDAVAEQLISTAIVKRNQIEDYFKLIDSQVRTMSSSHMVVEAMSGFKNTFEAIYQGQDIKRVRENLSQYYNEQFNEQYKLLNNGVEAGVHDLVTQFDDETVTLQYHYILANNHPMGSKHKLDAADDGSDYSRLHTQYHPELREYLDEFGFYDIFLVDSITGNIVYSVYKEIDYATSLLDGPYSNTGIGKAFRAVRESSNANVVSLTDFAPYKPSYDAPASFISSPIIKNGQNIGVLIFQMPIERINAVMTNNDNWKEVGMGKSGETYLIGDDMTMRSQSRFLIQDKDAYLKTLQNTGVDLATVRAINEKNTSIGLQKVSSDSARQALKGNSGFHIIEGYRGVEVLSAFTPIDILGLHWGLIAEIGKDESLSPTATLTNTMVKISVGLFLLIVIITTLIGTYISSGLIRPINALNRVMLNVESKNDLRLRAACGRSDEIGNMSKAFNSMLEKFEILVKRVSRSSQHVADASTEVSRVALDSSENIKQQYRETDQVASAMNEMARTLRNVLEDARSATEASEKAKIEARSGIEVISLTSNTITQLANAVENSASELHNLESQINSIGTVLDVIRGVAEQTNLLALNAAIEAARAGEQGRGFAVVADEVRTLASRTQASTHEIHKIIEALQTGAKQSVIAMEEGQIQARKGVKQTISAASSLNSVADVVDQISALNITIVSSAERQHTVAEEMNRNIININQIAEKSATGSAKTNAASDELSTLACELRAVLEEFKIS
ncbi:methyl-accepting chemotaxis protein [Alteromonas oceanisediminis]|uniref:methyl-accepting chemotaxis protein n=1 Tax=Alteromonas oceanisediminis TaxID=2836180 RepID=UPI001BDA7726|nr:methyl-accepting chemotaxis protein [Alteromonas oceanisediminis]MBT0587058.1 methyl-accepting chemotaxis protein [Alteromonas oceanisediminis]